MIFRYAIIYTADVATTVDFYRRAFALEQEFVHVSGDYAELATGATRLAFSSHRLMAELGKQVATEPPARPAFEIALETEDVAAALTRALAAGAGLVQGVEEMPWGQVTAYVTAPEGTLVELCTAVAPTG